MLPILMVAPGAEIGWWPLAAIVILLILSALASASEVAFFSLSPSDLQTLQSKGNLDPQSRAQRVLDLLKSPDSERAPRNLLATILVLNNLVNIFIILISTVVIEALFPAQTLPEFWKWTINVVGITGMIVLFGEVLPKVYATQHGLAIAQRMAFPLTWVQRLLQPIWRPLVKLGGWVDRRMGAQAEALSVADLEQALVLTESSGRTEEEKRILEGIVALGSKDAKQVMTARTDMESLASHDAWKRVCEVVLESGYSRIPVHNGSPDHILGILHVKDLIPHIGAEECDWLSLLRPAGFVPENKKIDDLMRDFQERKQHLAIVVDEYGGTSGLITLEDIIEEIVGEIADEFDGEELHYSRLDERTFLVEAKTTLIDLYRLLDLPEETWEAAKGESDTLGGFITEQAGRLLRNGERIQFDGVEMTIDAATPRKLLRVKVQLPDAQGEHDAV